MELDLGFRCPNFEQSESVRKGEKGGKNKRGFLRTRVVLGEKIRLDAGVFIGSSEMPRWSQRVARVRMVPGKYINIQMELCPSKKIRAQIFPTQI